MGVDYKAGQLVPNKAGEVVSDGLLRKIEEKAREERL